MGNLSLARLAECLDDDTRYILDQVLEACLRARDLTHQLLTFSKGGSPIKRTTSISEIIRESVQFALRGSNIRPEFTLPDQLWSVDADEGQLNQVINNLAINAQQAMPEGGVVHFFAENKQLERSSGLPLEPGQYVMVAVRDQGVGIPSKYLERIFDPYFSTKQKGSGLGLAIAHSIIQKHGGSISVDSEVGKGSTFCIFLPASTETVSKNRNATGTLDFGSGRILVMDDEEMIRFLATKMLKHLGYETITAPDGQEALTVYQDALQKGTPFDAVIVDLTVPGGMGGKKTLQHLKEIDPEVKCIVSSGYSDDPIMAEYHRYGFSAVIAKPYTIAHMGETLASVLNHK